MTEDTTGLVLHATAVAIDGHGLLLTGPSGAGKSDLALRLIDAGALLVADDRTHCCPGGAGLILSAPAAIAGLIEVRGVGIIAMPAISATAVLVLDCGAAPERLPVPAHRVIAGVSLPLLNIDALAPSAPQKARAALALAAAGRLWREHGDEHP